MLGTMAPTVSHVKRAFRTQGSPLQVRHHDKDEVVFSAKVVVPDVATPQRTAWRETMRVQAKAWAALTAAEKQSWKEYATRYARQLERLRRRTSCEPFHGYRVFSSTASNLLAHNRQPLRNAPAYGPFDALPALTLEPGTLSPALRFRVAHSVSIPQNYVLQVRMTPPTKTRARRPRRKDSKPINGSVAQSSVALPPSGDVVEFANPIFQTIPDRRIGIDARILRLSDGMAGPWAWFAIRIEEGSGTELLRGAPELG